MKIIVYSAVKIEEKNSNSSTKTTKKNRSNVNVCVLQNYSFIKFIIVERRNQFSRVFSNNPFHAISVWVYVYVRARFS